MIAMLGAALVAALAVKASATSLTSQPVIWEDLADLDVFRVGSDFYYSASSMHYSPGVRGPSTRIKRLVPSRDNLLTLINCARHLFSIAQIS